MLDYEEIDKLSGEMILDFLKRAQEKPYLSVVLSYAYAYKKILEASHTLGLLGPLRPEDIDRDLWNAAKAELDDKLIISLKNFLDKEGSEEKEGE